MKRFETRSSHRHDLDAAVGRLDSPGNIKAVPEPLLAYIHALKTVCDRAGDGDRVVPAPD